MSAFLSAFLGVFLGAFLRSFGYALNLPGGRPDQNSVSPLRVPGETPGETPMAYTESDLRAAAAAGLLEGAQLSRLLEFLRARGASAIGEAAPAPRFDVAHLLWYAGAL